jgi:hypothetical protein
MSQGFEEEKTVKVVKNGVGGAKQGWNPETRCFLGRRLRFAADGNIGKWTP